MAFRTTRGRPKKQQPATDTGTPELVMKRLCHVTTEPLDICLERGLITDTQHSAALHFRWLYSLRYGTASVSALDLSDPGGRELKERDPTWLAAREVDYRLAMEILSASNNASRMLALVVCGQPPAFLRKKGGAAMQREILKLQEALELLVQLWQRGKRRRQQKI
jgi:hypothetical protein